jgi:hypothetical protein
LRSHQLFSRLRVRGFHLRATSSYRLPATGYQPASYRLPATGYWLTIAAIAATAACGKKGPPLAPIVRVPAAVEQLDARRVGDDVYVSVTIPVRNIDKTIPADVARVEIYGYTGVTPPGARFLERGTLVGTIPVAPPLRPGDPPAPPTPPTGDAVQGARVSIVDRIDESDRVAAVLPPLPPGARRQAPASPTVPPTPGLLRRFYIAIPFSDRGRSGPAGTIVAELPLGMLPEPPRVVLAYYTPDEVRLQWEPSGGLFGFLTDRTLPVEPPPTDDIAPGIAATAPPPVAPLPPGPTRYNVYRDLTPDPLALPVVEPEAPWRAVAPAPINAAPIDQLTLADPLVFDDRQRCYVVRAVRGVAPAVVESEPSPRVCFTPIDVFPPETPTGLSAVSGAGSISLLWDPNIDLDLAGYVVLRGAPGDATLTPLTPTPIATARYVDRAVTPGTRYVYAVVAVDSRLPLGNVSNESLRVEETGQ